MSSWKKYRGMAVGCFFAVCAAQLLLCLGCEQAPMPAPKPAEAKLKSLGPTPDPTRDEAANLIKACGLPTTDKRLEIDAGTQRIMSWRRYGVDIYLLLGSDSPKWVTTGIFLIGGEETIDRITLSKKMPCARKVKLYAVDEFINALMHGTGR